MFEAVSSLLTAASEPRPAAARARRPALGRPVHPPAAAPRSARPERGRAPDRRAPTATWRSRPSTRSPSCWPTCAATGCSSAFRSTASTDTAWRADRVARRPGGALRAGADGPLGDRGQPVLRRGGGAPPDRDRADVRARRAAAARRDAGQIGVPEGVKEVLARRLARLSDTCRTVLSHAAVLGREFPFELLPAMTGLDDEAVIGALEEALGRPAHRGGRRPALRVHPRARARDALRRAERAAPPADARARGARDRGRRRAATTTRRIAALALHYRLAGADGRRGQGNRLLAARRRARPPAVRLGRGRGALGRARSR